MKSQRVSQLKYPIKHQARVKLGIAIKQGKVVRPNQCSRCGKVASRIEGHHPDYEQPLLVEWYCPPCHFIIHPHGGGGKPKTQTVPCNQCDRLIDKRRNQITCYHCKHNIRLICEICGTHFQIYRSDYNRRMRRRSESLLKKWFCSTRCTGMYLGQNFGRQPKHA